MATDSTPPYNRVIAITALATVVILFGLRFVFESYFTTMSEMAAREKLAPTTDLDRQRAEEQKLLTTAPMPIRVAISEVARARVANPLIEPRPSDDMGAMKGWSEAERTFDIPPPTRVVAPQADAGAPPTQLVIPPTVVHPPHR